MSAVGAAGSALALALALTLTLAVIRSSAVGGRGKRRSRARYTSGGYVTAKKLLPRRFLVPEN